MRVLVRSLAVVVLLAVTADVSSAVACTSRRLRAPAGSRSGTFVLFIDP